MNQDLTKTPFSRFGSHITIWQRTAEDRSGAEPGLWLGGVHGFNSGRESFRIALFKDGTEIPFATIVVPSHLTLRGDGAEAEVCIADNHLVRIRCRKGELRLILAKGAYNFAIAQEKDRWTLNPARSYEIFSLDRVSGELDVQADWGIAKADRVELCLKPSNEEPGELALHEQIGYAKPPRPQASFDEAVTEVAGCFDEFAAPYRSASDELRETIDEAAYLNWSCIVGARGLFQRPSMLMSKNWMTNVWSWDHAINGLALAEHHPQLAWDQLMTIFDSQLSTGQLPDFVNDAVRLYSYVKPPIHGWILSRMRALNPWFNDKDRLAEFYDRLAAWTRWWFEFRGNDFGLFNYFHGNDSGWDNGTVFDSGIPSTAPDAPAYLVLQMAELANIDLLLGRTEKATEWNTKADALQRILIDRLWDGRRFKAINPNGENAPGSDSIFGCLPIVLGSRLPSEMINALEIEIWRHLTEWGLATENPESALYEPDGYWRGPIWAPPTLIVADGLLRAGRVELASEIASRFCRLCKHAGLFAENFDAVTGAPLRDPAYTWTSSVFLLMSKMAS